MSRVITIQHSLFSKQTNSSEMNEPIFGKKTENTAVGRQLKRALH